MPSHRVKSVDCRGSALALQRRPGLMRSENTRLVIMANWANDLDFALRSQYLAQAAHTRNRIVNADDSLAVARIEPPRPDQHVAPLVLGLFKSGMILV